MHQQKKAKSDSVSKKVSVISTRPIRARVTYWKEEAKINPDRIAPRIPRRPSAKNIVRTAPTIAYSAEGSRRLNESTTGSRKPKASAVAVQWKSGGLYIGSLQLSSGKSRSLFSTICCT